ncbi:MAG: gliding motility-associated C-terminal domain-containing protein [Runella sp.]
MRHFYISFLFVVFVAFYAKPALADHMTGGDFTVSLRPNGNHQFKLTVFAEFTTIVTGGGTSTIGSLPETPITIYIFRKSDHVRMDSLRLTRPSGRGPSVLDAKLRCLGLPKLFEIFGYEYTGEINLNPARYNHPQGYYAIWDRCCRANNVTNISNSNSVGIAYRVDFPAVVVGGIPFRNSTPAFTTLDGGRFVCVNQNFSFTLPTQDADGDELRYSFEAPLRGHTTNTTNNNVGRGQSYTTYPPIPWATGFSLDFPLGRGSTLRINPTTGEISGRADLVGVFVIAVVVTEYRNGVAIGIVRREYHLLVRDCEAAITPPPIVVSDTLKARQLCPGDTLTLRIATTPNVRYQWLKDDNNIVGATTNTLIVREVGRYQVRATATDNCRRDSVSLAVEVRAGQAPPLRIAPADTARICAGDTAILEAFSSPSARFEWFRQNTVIAGATQNRLRTPQVGSYTVVALEQTSPCPARASVVVALRPQPPKPTIQADKLRFCSGDSVQIQATAASGFDLEWRRDGRATGQTQRAIFTKLPGVYQLRISAGRCEAISDNLTLQELRTTITFDSIPAICFNDTLFLPLLATPVGGSFSGRGITDNRFQIAAAGVGRHLITYQYQSPEGCKATTSRYVEVRPLPQASLPPTLLAPPDREIQLIPTIPNPTGYTYAWSPPTGLNNPASPNPTVVNPQNTTYTLTITNTEGCQLRISTRLVISSALYIPDVFTPNGDGLNDTWKISNAESFSEIEVWVYNRWGEVVFYSSKGYKTPWDGTFGGMPVSEGFYTYIIAPNDERNPNILRGRILVLR